MPAIVDTLRYVLELDDKGFRAGADQAERAVVGLGNSIRTTLTVALAGLATGLAAVRLGEFLKDAALTAARTEVLGTALETVGKTANINRGYLALLEEQVKGLGITTQAARESIIRFIQSGLPLEKLTALARTAQNSAAAVGVSSAEAFDRLLRGIQTRQVELIRSGGIFISVEQTLRQYAKTMGVAADQISQAEQTTAILNAVLENGGKLAGLYEKSMGDVGEQMTSLPRYIEEAKNAIGEVFLPILEMGVETLKEFSLALREAFTNDALLEFQEFIKTLGEGQIVPGSSQAVDAAIELDRLKKAMADVSEELAKANRLSSLPGIGSAAQAVQIRRLTREYQQLSLAYEALQERITGAGAAAEKQKEADAAEAARNEKLKERARLLGEIQKATPTGGFDIPVQIRMETSDEEIMRKILANEDLGPNEISVIIDLDDQNFRHELEAAIAETEQKFQRILRPVLTQEFPGGEMSAITQEADRLASLQEAADVTKKKFTEAFRNVQTIASSVFRAIAGEAGQVLDDILGALGNFATGNIAGGIAGIISGFAGIFSSTTDTTNRLILSNKDLIEAIQNWEESVFQLTDRQRADQQEAAERVLRLLDRGGGQVPLSAVLDARKALEDAGFTIPEGATIDQLLEIARAMLAELGDLTISSEAIRQADTRAEQNALIAQARSFNEAQLLVRTFADLFDLSLEDQQALLQQVFDDLAARGLLSEADRIALITSIEDLGDRIEAQSDTAGPTQTERSIARITERQSDTLISALVTLDLHLRAGFEAVVASIENLALDSIGRVATVSSGGDISIGAINVYAPTGNGADISKTIARSLEVELRAAGSVRLTG